MELKTCSQCKQPLPKRVPPVMGTILHNRYRDVLGVVIAPVGSALEDPSIVTVTVVNGAQAGQRMNWYGRNSTVVHGHFHVTERL